MSDEPKRRYITKIEFASYMGVNRSQVTRAVKSGRIRETKSGKIDWKQASEDWENNRSDHLSGTGRANNRKKRTPGPPLPGVPNVPRPDDIDDFGDMDDIDADAPKTADPDDIGKPPKRNTRAYEEYREKKAKAEWAEMKVRKEKGELLERTDVLAVYGATLNGLKTGVMSLPQRTTMKVMGVVKEWMATHGIAVDANKLIFLEKSVQDAITGEAHFVLTDILHKIENVTQEADTIAEKRR
jgi:hypothetical protein